MATAVPPCVLPIYLALLCAVQVILTTTDAVEERRAESEELELVVEHRIRKIVSSNTFGSVRNPPIY